jgi:hypothetical protein
MPGAGRRGSWFLSDNSKRSLWWVFILSLAVSWLAGGCQPPQVPEYDATPDPEAIRVAYVDGNDLAIMRIDGTQTVNLARGLQPTDCAPYYISPDGQWIAYQQADGLYAQ